ncbi:MAG: cobyrinate a,c-diamide synthase [Chloroflexota bacterium]|nr:cobyrinate a,c-diamide synthase [Chloroflexota bacterium]
MTVSIPRILIAGTSSGVGKTTIATGIVAALRKRGLRVQPFKCGPDYIDPSYLSLAAGIPTRNLDSWMIPPYHMLDLFKHAVVSKDIAVVEGVMGLYDGRGGAELEGSTAEIAMLLRTPVVLVIDVAKMSGSAAAVALGYRDLEPNLNIVGVILNNVGSDNHLRWASEAIVKRVGLPVLGCLHKQAEVALPERHLGLVPAIEEEVSREAVDRIRDYIEASVDVNELLRLARVAEEIPEASGSGLFPKREERQEVTLAVARDRAFDFYYEDNLDLLSAWGAQLQYVSPLEDKALPSDLRGLYIGGGFPEMYARELSANKAFHHSVVDAVQSGIPIYAECGGLMYLTEGIIDFEKREHAMVGVVPGKSVMRDRLTRMGYVEAEVLRDTPLAIKGQRLRGHVFHWSQLPAPKEGAAYCLRNSEQQSEGYVLGPCDNVLASYVHLPFGGDVSLAKRFVESCHG